MRINDQDFKAVSAAMIRLLKDAIGSKEREVERIDIAIKVHEKLGLESISDEDFAVYLEVAAA